MRKILTTLATLAAAASLAVAAPATSSAATLYNPAPGLSFTSTAVTLATGNLPANRQVKLSTTNPAYCEDTRVRYLLPDQQDGDIWEDFTDAGDGSVICDAGTVYVTLVGLPEGSRVSIEQPYTGDKTAISGSVLTTLADGNLTRVTYKACSFRCTTSTSPVSSTWKRTTTRTVKPTASPVKRSSIRG